MQLSEMRTLLARLLDDDGVRRSNAVLAASINDGYQMIALASQGCERTMPLDTLAGYHLVELPVDFYVPVAVYWSNSRLYPVRLSDLDLLNSGWISAAAGTPLYYFTVGSLTSNPQMWFYPRSASAARIRLVYAAVPHRLAVDQDTPQIPESFHYSIVRWACMWELLKERGALLVNKAFNTLLDVVQEINELQNYMYLRTPDRDFQMVPWDAEAVRKKILSTQLKPTSLGPGMEQRDLLA